MCRYSRASKAVGRLTGELILREVMRSAEAWGCLVSSTVIESWGGTPHLDLCNLGLFDQPQCSFLTFSKEALKSIADWLHNVGIRK